MRMNNLSKSIFAVIAIISIAACSISTSLDASIEKEVDATTKMKEIAKAPDKIATIDTIRVKEDIWLGNKSNVEYDGEPIPSALEGNKGITLVSNRPITLYEIGDMINKITALKVRISSKLEKEALSNASKNKPTPSDFNATWAEPNKMMVSYSGPLSGLLDEVSSRFGIWWKYEKGEVYFYKHVTKSFTLYSLPTKPKLDASVGGKASGDGGGTTINLSTSAELALWEKVKSTIKAMIDADSKIVADKANGVVTVTATPTDIKKVAKYINEQNNRLGRQVAISVKVLQVDLKNTDNYGLDLDATFNNGGPNFSDTTKKGSIVNKFVSSEDANFTFGLIRGDITLDAAIQALSTQGTTSLVTSSSVTTLNNKPAPVQVTRKQNYISELTRTDDGDSDNVDITVETEELETGFTMDVLPRIMDHGRILMMFNLTISELIDLETVLLGATKDQGSIQNPIVESRGFTQEIAMKSGQSLVLTGFEKVKNKADKSGIGSAETSILGGSAAAEKTRSVLVVILTPVVLDSPLLPESRMKLM